MNPYLQQRIAYGREIRLAAQRVVTEHGVRAEAAAWRAVADDQLADSDRAFQRYVAERISRWMNQFTPFITS